VAGNQQDDDGEIEDVQGTVTARGGDGPSHWTSRGFGFVEMPNNDEAEKAIPLERKRFGGRALTVNEARPKVDRGGRGGGGVAGTTIPPCPPAREPRCNRPESAAR